MNLVVTSAVKLFFRYVTQVLFVLLKTAVEEKSFNQRSLCSLNLDHLTSHKAEVGCMDHLCYE